MFALLVFDIVQMQDLSKNNSYIQVHDASTKQCGIKIRSSLCREFLNPKPTKSCPCAWSSKIQVGLTKLYMKS
jgi:hypothetical protein